MFRWVVGPALSVAVAALIVSLLATFIGESPMRALGLLISGSFGSPEAIGFTLFYTTSFIFAGLAVAMPFRAGLFNIGVEGQASVAGIALSIAALQGERLGTLLASPAALAAGCAGGIAWALIPAYLQVRRGSHIVITTIMLNFIASALLGWLLVDTLRAPGSMQTESRPFAASTALPRLDTLLEALGLPPTGTPLNIGLLLALVAAGACWLILFRTRTGYRIRVLGLNPDAATYAGISPLRISAVVMGIAGICAAGAAANELLGAQNRLILDFVGGAGFVGIAVAFMGRNHPLGVLPAALLFGALMQGGAELAFEMPKITRDMIVLVQGLVVLLVGGTHLLPNIFSSTRKS
jgi:simple sugar transport system permease protein